MALIEATAPPREVVRLVQRVYLTAFPKAGTHLAELFIRYTAAPIGKRPWVGTFDGNAWTTIPINKEKLIALTEEWTQGGYLKGHCGYDQDIARALWDGAICTIFVYRDLRDVLVSQAYHILSDAKDKDGKDQLKHPGKALFRKLGSFENIMIGCIEGVAFYPGIITRWEQYRGWLDERWVLKVSFEDMIQQPRETGSRILRYVTGQSAGFVGLRVSLDQASHDEMVDGMLKLVDDHKPVTFRKGIVGDWRNHWTDRIDEAWRKAGGPEANEELGYGVHRYETV